MKLMNSVSLVSLLAFLAACGGSGKIQTLPLSGNWQITLQSKTLSATETQTGFLLQSANGISGGAQFSGQTITIAGTPTLVCNAVGTAQGQLTGTNVSLTFTQPGQTINLTGTTANNSTSMSGNYSILASGCGQTEVGTWSANQVDPLSGGFQATFTPYSNSSYNQPFSFTGTITQGMNTGGSTATVSGTMTSTDLPCFSTATIAGVVSGSTVVLNLLTTDGIALGKISGGLASDATTITGGTFSLNNAVDPAVLGVCYQMGVGTSGTVAITIQPSSPSTT